MLTGKHGAANMQTSDILSIMFAAVSLIGIIGGIANRLVTKKGIGSQFIRLMALVLALPLAAALVFQGMLTEAAISLLLGILGYVFPGSSKEG